MLKRKRHLGWRTTGRSHTLNRGSVFFPPLLTCTTHSASPTAPTELTREKKGSQREKGEELKKALVSAFLYDTFKRLQLKQISQWTVWDLLNGVFPLERERERKKTKQLQAILVLFKWAQLFEVANRCNQLKKNSKLQSAQKLWKRSVHSDVKSNHQVQKY